MEAVWGRGKEGRGGLLLEYNMLWIADEVQTGLARTGSESRRQLREDVR